MNVNVSPLEPSSDVTEQIARLIWMLCQTVTERCGLHVRTLSKEQVEYIVNRILLPARKRFRRVVAQIRAGKPPKIRARKPRKPRPVKPKRKTIAEIEREVEIESRTPLPRGWRRWPRADRVRARAEKRAAKELDARLRAAENKPVPVWRTLRMHMFGWLCRCAPTIYRCRQSAPGHANELRRLLADPEMRALLMANRYVGDSLKRVCRGLHLELSLLYPGPDEAAAPVAAAPEPTPAPEPAIKTPEKIVAVTPPAPVPPSVTPPVVKIGAPGERGFEKHFPGAVTASPPAVAGPAPWSLAAPGAPWSLASPGAPEKSDFFARD